MREKIIDMGDRFIRREELSLQEQLNEKKSENKKLEEQLIEAKEKLKQMNEMFLMISHDLRSPLQGILGFLELIIEDIKDNSSLDEDLKDQLKLVNKSAQSLFTLMTNVLIWAKNTKEGANIELLEMELRLEVENVFNSLKINALSKRIELINEIENDLVVFSNKEAINIILSNLISNAIKFTPQDGRIKISSKETSSGIEIIVEDNGVGVDNDRLDKIFNMKESTIGTNREQGNGLGLYLCKEIIEKLGGNIKVKSKIGEGTKFIVTLPVKEVKE